jgi:hypothetical protein
LEQSGPSRCDNAEVQRWADLLAVDGAARTTVADPDPTTGAERGQVVRRWVDGAGGANWGRSASRLDAGRRRLGEQLEAEDMLTMELLGEPARVGGRAGGGTRWGTRRGGGAQPTASSCSSNLGL